MNSTVDQLIDLLRQESELYRSLLVVIDREKKAAIRPDLNALNEAGIDKEKHLLEINNKEERRRHLVARLAEAQGVVATDLTLTKISQWESGPQTENLRQVSQEFSALLARVQAANRRNQQIVEHSLVLLKGSFNLLNQLMTPNTVYYRTGSIQRAKSTGKCVCSEI
jgi:flagellar biosynthesis/type III secretory pathway chaperone